MHSDRELLEMAAKAAGLKGSWNREVACIRLLPGKKTPYGMIYSYWDPLTDDGDALRLAVKLGIAIYPPEADGDGATVNAPGPGSAWISEPVDAGDACAATRRAIVTAAAGLSKACPALPLARSV